MVNPFYSVQDLIEYTVRVSWSLSGPLSRPVRNRLAAVRLQLICECVLCLTAEDVMMETVVEVSTECGPIEEESFPIPPDCEPAVKRKRGGQCHYNTPPRLNVCWRPHGFSMPHAYTV